MISPNKIIVDTSLARRLEVKDLIKGIRETGHQIDSGSSTPLITDLRMNWTFEDEAEEEGASVTDLVLSALRLLWGGVIYLSTRSLLLDSSLLRSDSQNTKELICWATLY